MVYHYLNGNTEKSMEEQLNALDLIHSLFCEVNPIPIKYAMNAIGFHCGTPRLPLIELTDDNKERIIYDIKHFQY